MRVRTFEHIQDWTDATVEHMGALLASIDHGPFICLTGGKTPKPLYEACRSLDFHHAHVYVADERFVPADHPDSNNGMIFRSLVEGNKTIGSYHPIEVNETIEKTIAAHTHELALIPDHIFDIFLLGIGPDGHILSLFPHTQALDITNATLVHTTTETFAVKDRITETFPFVTKAKHIVLFASGSDKWPVIDALQKGEKTVNEMPVMAIKDHQDLSIFFLK